MGYQTVAGGNFITGDGAQVIGPGAAFIVGKVTATILPGVQGTDRIALGIQVEDAVHLTYHMNKGAAFGMMADSRWIFMVISTVAIIAMGYYLYAGLSEKRIYTVSVAMIISGGIGNMIDRVAIGAVVDFIDFRIIDFAIFNGADSFVCVGAGILMLALILDIVREAKEKKKTND